MLKKIAINGHGLFSNLSFPLSSACDAGTNYKTVIIGPNGTGKSTILSCIADALTIECSERKIKSLIGIDYSYDLEAEMAGKALLISSSDISSGGNFGKGKILAISSTPNDRFPFLAKNSVRKSEHYVYLGLKTASNNIFFSNMKEKMFQDMLLICRSTRRVNGALEVLNKLGFNSKFSITLERGSNFAAFNDSGRRKLHSNAMAGSASFQNAAFRGFVTSDFYIENEVAIKDFLTSIENDASAQANLSTISRNKKLFDKLTMISRLTEAKILTIKTLSIFSNNGIDLHQSSSGEFNILRIFLSIIAHVENDSVIMIDEPEISLHPNWQIDFLSILDAALVGFLGCHSLIATHSHFLLSNLEGRNSTILALQFNHERGEIFVDALDVNSYGWSPEHTLYQVFGVTGFRNKYLELDLRIIIDYMSNDSGSFRKFKESLGRIRKFNITEIDPLFKLINKAEKIIKEKS
ncbi:AAA family ATPase [Janthinobacterium sp. TB1-E2]|uniref:AAA family ATPase n=1 Tax=Janthinobacterium aestuarii TaxID=2985511 RepID=A0ABZ2GJL6_9BURK